MTLSFRFGTVGSPINTPKKPGGSVGGIQYLRQIELNALELGWVNAVRVTPVTCAAIKLEGLRQDVSLSVHAPYFINLNANEGEWPKARQRLMDAAHYGNLAGATDIIFHPGSYFGLKAEEVLPLAIERLQNCQDELRASGNQVTLRPETMGKSALLGSLEDTLELSRHVPGVEPCVDFAHLHARSGDGSVNTYAEFSRILEMIAEILGAKGLTSLHIHLSGIAYGPKGEKEHLELKEADLNINELFMALHEFKCSGRILCESPVLEDDALLLKSTWCSISGET